MSRCGFWALLKGKCSFLPFFPSKFTGNNIRTGGIHGLILIRLNLVVVRPGLVYGPYIDSGLSAFLFIFLELDVANSDG